MNNILHPIVLDKLTGYDQYGQLVTILHEDDGYRSWFIRNVSEKTCGICGKPWELTTKSLQNQYCVEDEVYHATCYGGHLKLNEYKFWEDALLDAGLAPFKMIEIPNGYGSPAPFNVPWYQVNVLEMRDNSERPFTGITLTVGSRKRVYSIQVESAGNIQIGENDFPPDDVTKGITATGFLIHAWNKEKVVEYIKCISKVIHVKYPRAHDVN